MEITEYGNSDGKQILCIHGLFMTGACFSSLSDHMPEYHFICITMDGHHENSTDFQSISQEAETVQKELLKRKNKEYILAIGLSLGTLVTLELAQNARLKINRLLLDGAVNLYTSSFQFFEKTAMSFIFRYFMSLSKHKEKALHSIGKIYKGDWPQYMYRAMKSMSVASRQVIEQEISNYKLKPGLSQSLYFLYGGKENNIKVNCAVIRTYYPKAKIRIIPGYRHLEFLNACPEKYSLIVRAILRNNPVS